MISKFYKRMRGHEPYWKFIFKLGIVLKGLNGLWEITGGIFLLFANKIIISKIFYSLAAEELLEDPHDAIINFLGNQINSLSISAQTFAGVYILIHGIVNLFLAIQLYRNKLYAYLVSIAAILVFILYQIYRISITHSIILCILTGLDIIFIIVIWHEYKLQKNKKSGTI